MSVIYSAVDDFSILNGNPNGVWTYLSETVLDVAASDGDLDYWTNVLASAAVYANTGAPVVIDGTIVLPSDYLGLVSGDDDFAGVVFTAPTNGFYVVTGSFLGIDTAQASHLVQFGPAGQFSTTIDTYDQLETFSFTVSLTAGSTLEFLSFGMGADNTATGLDVEIFAAASFTWNAGVSGDWDVGANWRQGSVPGALDRAVIGNAGTYTVTSQADRVLASFALRQATATLAVTDSTFATIDMDNRGTIVVGDGAADAIVEIGGLLRNGGTITLMGGDPFTGISGVEPMSRLVNVAGTVEGSGGIDIDLFNYAGSLIDANVTGEILEIVSGFAVNGGTMRASNGGTLFLSANLFFDPGGVLEASGTDSQFVLADTLMFGPAVLQASDGGSFAAVGFNYAANGLTLAGDLALDASLYDFDAVLAIEGKLVNNGAITIAGVVGECGCDMFGALLIGPRGATIQGGGTIIMAGLPENTFIEEQLSIDAKLINVDNTIEGAGTIGFEFLSVYNEAAGTIDANVAGEALVIDTGGSLFVNRGTLRSSDGGTLSVVSDARGFGSAVVEGGTLEFQGASKAMVSFESGNGLLELDTSSAFKGTVAGLAESDGYSIDLTDIAFDTVSAVFRQAADLSRGALSITDGTDSAKIVLLGQYAADITTSPPLPGFTGFVLSDDGTADHGTKVTYVTAAP